MNLGFVDECRQPGMAITSGALDPKPVIPGLNPRTAPRRSLGARTGLPGRVGWLFLGLMACIPAIGARGQPVVTPKYDTTTPSYDLSGVKEKAVDTVLAEVDGRAVTLGDVGDYIRQLPGNAALRSFDELLPSVLDKLVLQQALVLRAQRQGLDADPEVKRRVKAAADAALAQEQVRREASAKITETMLLDAYKRATTGRPGPEVVRARIIRTENEPEAAGLLKEIKDGADFAEVARRASRDPTAGSGGDLGFVQRNQLNTEIGSVAFALGIGEVASYPVRSAGGWFIVKTEARRRDPAPPYPMMREDLLKALVAQGTGQVLKDAMENVTLRVNTIMGVQNDTLPE